MRNPEIITNVELTAATLYPSTPHEKTYSSERNTNELTLVAHNESPRKNPNANSQHKHNHFEYKSERKHVNNKSYPVTLKFWTKTRLMRL